MRVRSSAPAVGLIAILWLRRTAVFAGALLVIELRSAPASRDVVVLGALLHILVGIRRATPSVLLVAILERVLAAVNARAALT